MKILILGGTGMLGHKLALEFCKDHDVAITTRTNAKALEQSRHFSKLKIIQFDRFNDRLALQKLLEDAAPDIVMNATGIIKQNDAPLLDHILINAVLPQMMGQLCAEKKIRFVTFSTDCVFDGTKGPYQQDEPPTAHDIYGMTKYLGEVRDNPFSITLRTSIIGPEIQGKKSLLEWILSNKGRTVFGFSKALYTGLPTIEISHVVRKLLETSPPLAGVWQVTSKSIDKASLIRLISDEFDLGITVNDNADFICDRRLDGSSFAKEIGYQTPSWPELVARMYQDYIDNQELYRAATIL